MLWWWKMWKLLFLEIFHEFSSRGSDRIHGAQRRPPDNGGGPNASTDVGTNASAYTSTDASTDDSANAGIISIGRARVCSE
jgi:hypothetical protein